MLPAGPVRNLGWLAAACFLAAWFLPAAADVPGWMAFRYAFSPVWRYGTAEPQGGEDAVAQVLSALTNVAFVVMFARLVRGTVNRPGLFLRVAIACFVLDLYWFVQLLRDGAAHELWIGYYVWLAAFALLGVVGWMLMRSARSAAATPPAA
jgi:heme/copper-type cytochrome/quinol oxidase subunit 4